MILVNNSNIKLKEIQNLINSSLEVIKVYEWLINSFVLDFFVDKHWDKLPSSWKSLQSVDLENISDLIAQEPNSNSNIIYPLSILAIKSILKANVISRKKEDLLPTDSKTNKTFPIKIQKQLEKGLKLKKRHEIDVMSRITNHTSNETGSKFIVDFGAGLGHFARVLSFQFDFKVCCIEMQQTLNENASVLDINVSKFLTKMGFPIQELPHHLTMKLDDSITSDEFMLRVKNTFTLNHEQEFSLGIVGLHPCGDLASILVRLFTECKEVKFLNLVGCCHMKLTQNNDRNKTLGYPLSNFLKNNKRNSIISYEAKEIACHAIEMYENRLRLGDYTKLKIHAYRAAIEKVIIKKYPDKKHIGLKSVKDVHILPFTEYCKLATKDTGIEILDEIDINEAEDSLKQWKKIVLFYTFRLLFAPLIESVILYDRILFLLEKGCKVKITTAFDPLISPRNHVIIATKN